MTTLLGGVHVHYVGAGEYEVHTESTRVNVHTESASMARIIGRAVAVGEGLIGGTVGAPSECPVCNSCRVFVTDSRTIGDAVRRRRRCKSCRAKWTSEERVLTIDPSDGCQRTPARPTETL